MTHPNDTDDFDFDLDEIMAEIEAEDDDILPDHPSVEVKATLPKPREYTTPPPTVDNLAGDMQEDWSGLTAEQIEAAPQIRASLPDGPAEYCTALLRETKAGFEATGAGYTFMFLVFSRKLEHGELRDAFKHRAQVKMSRIRKAAAESGHVVPDFNAVILCAHPVDADADGKANTWFVRCARFHPETYRAYLAHIAGSGNSHTSQTAKAIDAL